ncbi:hypothetical protein HD554DRAFT_1262165 [Boletus coccyginus]|nr:hypothetical protein HD554DRAFT_1262165 [Boletus coccyginus]
MSSASSTPLSAAELENLCVLFIGFVAASVLYGLTFFQTYIYYSRYPRDHKWIRYFVATLCTLDTAVSALVCEVLYYYLIIMFDVNMDVLYATTTFCFQYMLSVLLTFISHLCSFFAHRAFRVTGGSKLVTVVLVFLSFIALVFGLTASGQMFAQRRLSAFGSPQMQIPAAISQVTSVMADMIIFVTMCYSLRPVRYPEIAVPSGFLPTVITMLLGRGLAFTVFQMSYFCVFIVAPSRQFWIPMQMVASKLYVNTLLGQLNSRDVKHGQGFNEEDSLTDHKSPTNGGFPASIGLNTNGKVTTRPIHLVTRQTDTESEGAELESRKTFHDEEGNMYAQVSTGTGSTQSQMDNNADKEGLSERIN